MHGMNAGRKHGEQSCYEKDQQSQKAFHADPSKRFSSGSKFVWVLLSCSEQFGTGEKKIKRAKPQHRDEYYQFECQHSTVISSEKRLKIANLNPTLVETGENKNRDAAKRELREASHRLCRPRQRKSRFFCAAIKNPEQCNKPQPQSPVAIR